MESFEKKIFCVKNDTSFFHKFIKKVKIGDPKKIFCVTILGVRIYMKKNRFFSKKKEKKSKKNAPLFLKKKVCFFFIFFF